MSPPSITTGLKYVPRISYENATRLAVAEYSITIPRGLTAADIPAPAFVTSQQLQARMERPTPAAKGLVTAAFSVAFPSPAAQWRQIPQRSGPCKWQFQGGEVQLRICLAVFIVDAYQPQPNDERSKRVFKLFMDHEIEHIADDFDIIKNWLPQEAYRDELLNRYLGQGQLMDDSMYQRFVRGPMLHDLLFVPWGNERNRRKRLRDSAEEYARLQDEYNRM